MVDTDSDDRHDHAAVVERVMGAVADLAPSIRATLRGRRGTVDAANPSGEQQLAADVRADELLLDRLQTVDGVAAYASEERAEVIDCGTGLSVATDPLDGSSNLKSNNPMGTIVGLYDAPLPARGRSLVGAGFVLYGPITTMVVAVDDAVTEYEIDDGEREPIGAVSLPEDPVVYGFGGRVPEWTDGFRSYARGIESELKLRYGGAMIADVSQVLTYGGVFAYPGLTDRPEGKLRLQFEGNPMAYVVETAGGASSDGGGSILDREPNGLHGRTPVHVGNEALIDRLEHAID
ncbi:fructose-bisphosphatase class I [Halobacteriales archaeon SW_7_68_16]|nr:MAG: fructose-bisphosphatase class I [Halobacteriales archaeon SW_7_68_16]